MRQRVLRFRPLPARTEHLLQHALHLHEVTDDDTGEEDDEELLFEHAHAPACGSAEVFTADPVEAHRCEGLYDDVDQRRELRCPGRRKGGSWEVQMRGNGRNDGGKMKENEGGKKRG